MIDVKEDMKLMKNLKFLFPVLALVLSCAITNCNTPQPETSKTSLKDAVEFAVPESVSLEKGTQTMEFRVKFQKAPLQSDVIVFASGSNKRTCPILETSVTKFTVSLQSLWDGFLTDGPYGVSIRRGSEELSMGTMSVSVVIPGDGVEPAAGSTVYGLVSCDGTPLAGVVVSVFVTRFSTS